MKSYTLRPDTVTHTEFNFTLSGTMGTLGTGAVRSIVVCGAYVYAGSEDGRVRVWKAEDNPFINLLQPPLPPPLPLLGALDVTISGCILEYVD
jgi:hypothetical protein